MQAYVLHGPGDLRRESRNDPQVGPADLLIDVRRVGICGSDIHYFRNFRIGDFIPQAPLVLGHEFAGEVVEVGREVTSFKVGDRVTVEPSIECQRCAYCRKGRYNLCTDLRFIGTAATVPHIDGAFAERVSAPARNCYLLPNGMDYGSGALIEPMAVGAHAVMRAGALAGRSILINGAGTIGQMVLTVARALGATGVWVADPSSFAREFSLSHGAAAAVDPTDPSAAEELKARGFDVVFEASGVPAALDLSIQTAARGGTVVQIGSQPSRLELPANYIMSRELTVLGSFRYAYMFGVVIELMHEGRVHVEELISVVYPFDEMPTAMDRAVQGGDVVKVQVNRE